MFRACGLGSLRRLRSSRVELGRAFRFTDFRCGVLFFCLSFFWVLVKGSSLRYHNRDLA